MTRSAITVRRLPKSTWDRLTPAFRDTSYRQLGSYAAAAARRVGATSELNGLYEDDTLVGLADVRVKTIPFTSLGIGYLSHAPVIRRDENFSAETFRRCVEALRREYVERRRLVLRVVPTLVGGGQFQELQTEILEACGFHPGAQKPRETFVLDLTRPLDAIRKEADPHWRRNLTKSEKSDIRITRSFAPDDFDRFEQIFLELTERKEFSTNQGVDFFRDVQFDLPAEQKLVLHLAWHGNDLLAGHLGSFVGDTAIYLLGATNAKGRDLRASYLLHWKVIEYAQSAGNNYYDLGGIDQQRNPGVFRFKQGLNGRPVADVGPFDCTPGNIRTRVLNFLEAARNATLSKA